MLKAMTLPLTGPGLVSRVAKGMVSNPKLTKGFLVPKNCSNMSCAFCLYE